MSTDQTQPEETPPEAPDPLWFKRLPVIVSEPVGSEKGKWILLGSLVLIVILATILKNYGIIGQ